MNDDLSSKGCKRKERVYLDGKVVAAWLHQVSDIKF